MMFYLIKLSISLAVITLFYWVFLRKLTFYRWNRWYLLGYSFLAFVLPFLDVYDFLEPGADRTAVVEAVPLLNLELLRTGMSPEQEAAWWQDPLAVAGVLLVAGMVFFILRLLMSVGSFLYMKKKAVLLQDGEVKVFALEGNVTHFSFGNNIFINPGAHNDGELQRILLHEYVHVRQKHTIDLLWAELLCLIMWFNPFAWLLRRAIRQNLEFLADAEVLRQGIAPKEYQLLLLKVMSGLPHSFVAPFGFSFLKKRIAMMNKNKTARIHAVRFIFVLPLLATIVLSFRSMADAQVPPAPPAPPVAPGMPPAPPVPPAPADTADRMKAFFERNPQLAGLGKEKNDGTQRIFVQYKEGDKFEYFDCNKEEEMALFEKKFGVHPEWPSKGTPVKQEAPVHGSLKASADTSLDPAGKQKAGSGGTATQKPVIVQIRPVSGSDTTKKPLIVVDGVIKEGGLEDIDTDAIKSITVLKDASATALYGEKGVNGVIVVTTKKEAASGDNKKPVSGTVLVTPKDSIRLKGNVSGVVVSTETGDKGNVLKLINAGGKGKDFRGLLIYDGEEYDWKEFEALKVDPGTIESVSVLKGGTATAKYGQKGKDGVIIITSKK